MIVGAVVARNEADRYLAVTLESMWRVCDEILVLDDGSTDDTAMISRGTGCKVKQRNGDVLWGNESSARAELWAWGSEVAKDGWLYISDADHELVGPAEDFKALTESWEVNCWGFRLYDCWDSPHRHRVDGQWAAFHVARPWLFKPSVCPDPQWGSRGLHSGHAPCNFPHRLGVAPSALWLRHYGWMDATDRDAKVARYTAAAEHLQPAELAHLQSVTDAHYRPNT